MIQDTGFRNKILGRRPRGFFRASCILNLESLQSGFTIVETMVAIAILLLSITAPLTIAEKGLATAEVAKDEITAFYLGQEAIEFVRNLRDTSVISGNGGKANWLKNINPNINECFKVSGCGVDTTNPRTQDQVVACNKGNDDCLLWQYTGNPGSPLFGIFGHRTSSDWSRSGITRKVTIDEIRAGEEATVTVTVVWTAGSLGSRTLTLKENLLNWYVSR